MTLNVKRKKDGDSKCLYEYAERLWMLKLKKNGGIECLNGYENDYERQN